MANWSPHPKRGMHDGPQGCTALLQLSQCQENGFNAFSANRPAGKISREVHYWPTTWSTDLPQLVVVNRERGPIFKMHLFDYETLMCWCKIYQFQTFYAVLEAGARLLFFYLYLHLLASVATVTMCRSLVRHRCFPKGSPASTPTS